MLAVFVVKVPTDLSNLGPVPSVNAARRYGPTSYGDIVLGYEFDLRGDYRIGDI